MLNTLLCLLKNDGASFLISSCRIGNLRLCTDRIALLSDGFILKSFRSGGKKRDETRNLVDALFPEKRWRRNARNRIGETVFEAVNIEAGLSRSVSFSLKKGEIAVIIDPARTVSGAITELIREKGGVKNGTLRLFGIEIRRWTYRWVRHEVILTDFDVQNKIIEPLPVIDNICFSKLRSLSSWGVIREKFLRHIAGEFAAWYGGSTLLDKKNCWGLSNREKTAIYLFRLRMTNPAVLFCLEPAAKADPMTYQMIKQELMRFAQNGTAVCVLVSSLKQSYGFADRCYVAAKDGLRENGLFRGLKKFIE
jgi:ABC-type sugar transport system ATPase subunit